MSRFVVLFMKDVLGGNGRSIEICQRSSRSTPRARAHATELAKQKFCESERLCEWSLHADRIQVRAAIHSDFAPTALTGTNFSEKRAPCGLRFSTVMSAECNSAMRCTIESPSPVLPCLRRSRRQKRRKISLRSSSPMPGPLVEHADGAVVLDDEFDGRSRRRVIDGVFGEVADGAAEHFRIALDPDRLGRARQRDVLALRQRQRRHELGDFGGDRLQIGLLVGIDDERVELGDVEQLADDMRHAVDILAQAPGASRDLPG